VGFLSLQEAYSYFEVGRFLKDPKAPIWVVYSESHYSVLFSDDIRLVTRPSRATLTIFYWDCLASQREEIRLTVRQDHSEDLPDPSDERALIPPLDLVVRTKWPQACVDWNGTEPIL
jgi:hypothetical protein